MHPHAIGHHLLQFLCFLGAVLVAVKIVPGIRARSTGGAVVFAVVLAILNKLLFTLLTLLALPFVIATLGLFVLVINAFLFWLADKLVKGVEVDGFGSAFFGALTVSVLNWAFHFLLHVVA